MLRARRAPDRARRVRGRVHGLEHVEPRVRVEQALQIHDLGPRGVTRRVDGADGLVARGVDAFAGALEIYDETLHGDDELAQDALVGRLSRRRRQWRRRRGGPRPGGLLGDASLWLISLSFVVGGGGRLHAGLLLLEDRVDLCEGLLRLRLLLLAAARRSRRPAPLFLRRLGLRRAGGAAIDLHGFDCFQRSLPGAGGAARGRALIVRRGSGGRNLLLHWSSPSIFTAKSSSYHVDFSDFIYLFCARDGRRDTFYFRPLPWPLNCPMSLVLTPRAAALPRPSRT